MDLEGLVERVKRTGYDDHTARAKVFQDILLKAILKVSYVTM